MIDENWDRIMIRALGYYSKFVCWFQISFVSIALVLVEPFVFFVSRCAALEMSPLSQATQEDSSRLCQGCPIIAIGRPEEIRWAPDAPELAEWVERTLELKKTRGLTADSSPLIVVVGWKGRRDIDEKMALDGRHSE